MTPLKRFLLWWRDVTRDDLELLGVTVLLCAIVAGITYVVVLYGILGDAANVLRVVVR